VTKNLLSRAPPCFGRHVKPFVAVVSTHQSAVGLRGGLWPGLLMVFHKESLCLSSGGINDGDDGDVIMIMVEENDDTLTDIKIFITNIPIRTGATQ
jgi:hypothetical protein